MEDEYLELEGEDYIEFELTPQTEPKPWMPSTIYCPKDLCFIRGSVYVCRGDAIGYPGCSGYSLPSFDKSIDTEKVVCIDGGIIWKPSFEVRVGVLKRFRFKLDRLIRTVCAVARAAKDAARRSYSY